MTIEEKFEFLIKETLSSIEKEEFLDTKFEYTMLLKDLVDAYKNFRGD